MPKKEKLDSVQEGRVKVAQIGRLLFERNLTDAAGGNISYRVGDMICITATKSGYSRQWQIDAEDVLVVDLQGVVLAGTGGLSRETEVHLDMHRVFGDQGNGIIHAHPRNIMVIAALALPLPPVIESTRRFGVTPVIDYAPSNTQELAMHVVESFRGREELIENHAAGCIAPWHGLFVMGSNLDAAFEAVDQLDLNAYCTIMGRMLVSSHEQDAARLQMESTIAAFQGR